jgi:hypothetical protein
MRKGIKMKNDNTIKEPRIIEVSVVAENIILLTVQEGVVEGGDAGSL